MTTFQSADGTSHFDKKSSINILGPKVATCQHWKHIALRKRDDLFAFFSSLYKIKKIDTAFGDYHSIFTERDATKKYPGLTGNWVDTRLFNTKDFFEIFGQSFFDIDDFYGTLHVDLLYEPGKPRGRIEFQGKIVLCGGESAKLCFIVPPGQLWIIRDQNFTIAEAATVTASATIVKEWKPGRHIYV